MYRTACARLYNAHARIQSYACSYIYIILFYMYTMCVLHIYTLISKILVPYMHQRQLKCTNEYSVKRIQYDCLASLSWSSKYRLKMCSLELAHTVFFMWTTEAQGKSRVQVIPVTLSTVLLHGRRVTGHAAELCVRVLQLKGIGIVCLAC